MEPHIEDLIVDQTNLKKLECGICYQLLDSPRQCSQGHLFCISCIKRSLQSKKTCPVCSAALTEQSLARSLFVEEAINNLSVHCKYHFKQVGGKWVQDEDGCNKITTKSTLNQHYESCKHTMVKCIYNPQQCPVMKRKQLNIHIVQCKFKPTSSNNNNSGNSSSSSKEIQQLTTKLETLEKNYKEKIAHLESEIDTLKKASHNRAIVKWKLRKYYGNTRASPKFFVGGIRWYIQIEKKSLGIYAYLMSDDDFKDVTYTIKYGFQEGFDEDFKAKEYYDFKGNGTGYGGFLFEWWGQDCISSREIQLDMRIKSKNTQYYHKT